MSHAGMQRTAFGSTTQKSAGESVFDSALVGGLVAVLLFAASYPVLAAAVALGALARELL